MKIICVGRNYSEHIKELDNQRPEEPVLFMKPDSAVILKNNPFILPTFSSDIHYEVEVLVKINKIGKHISREFASDYYEEVGLGIDFTARDLQSKLKEKGLPWERAKAFDGSVLFSDFIELTPEMTSYMFELHIDGKVIQHGETQLMLHQPAQILAEVNEFMGLEEGDIIMTGTPAGVGMVSAGREFKVALYSDSGQQCLLEHHWSVNQS